MPEPIAQWWARRQLSRGADVPYAVGTYRESWQFYPALVRQYHPEFNGGIVLSQIPPAADVFLCWQCDVGHVFVATPAEQRSRPGRERRRSSWCPDCLEAARPRTPVMPMREGPLADAPASPLERLVRPAAASAESQARPPSPPESPTPARSAQSRRSPAQPATPTRRPSVPQSPRDARRRGGATGLPSAAPAVPGVPGVPGTLRVPGVPGVPAVPAPALAASTDVSPARGFGLVAPTGRAAPIVEVAAAPAANGGVAPLAAAAAGGAPQADARPDSRRTARHDARPVAGHDARPVAGSAARPDAPPPAAPRRKRPAALCTKTPDLPPGTPFLSTCAPPPASAVEGELRAFLTDTLEFTTGLNAIRLARPFFDHVEVWPDVILPELRVAIEYDSTGRFGLEHVGHREDADWRKDRALRGAGWEVIRIRTGRLPALGPHDLRVGGLSKNTMTALLDELRVVRGELIVDCYLRSSY